MMKSLHNLAALLLLSAASIYCSEANSGNGNTPVCTQRGFFPVPGSCQDYYQCRYRRGQFFVRSNRCESGMIFDTVFSECKLKSEAIQPEHCLEEAPVTTTAPKLNKVEVVPVNEAGNVHADNVQPGPAPTFETSSGNVHADNVQPGPAPTFETSSGNDTSKVHADNIQSDPAPTFETIPTEADFNVTLNNENIDANVPEATPVVEEVLTTCEYMTIVDEYVTQLISTPSLRPSVEYQQRYNEIVEQYNKDLQTAQQSTIIWRNGESILSGIKNTYQKASNYQFEFNKKYEVYQRIIQTLPGEGNNEKYIQRLRDDIKVIEEDIKSIEETLSFTDAPNIREYFEKSLESKRNELLKKQQQINSSSALALELKEAVVFLTYVKADADIVEDLAINSITRIEDLRQSLYRDGNAFEKHGAAANEDILHLTAEDNQFKELIANNEAEQAKIESEMKGLDARINNLNIDNTDILQEMNNLNDIMDKKTTKFQEERALLCREGGIIDSYINEYTTADQACNILLRQHNIILDVTQEMDEHQSLSRQHQINIDTINRILPQKRTLLRNIRTLVNALPNYRSKLQEADGELVVLRRYADEVDNLQIGVTSTIQALEEIITVFQDMNITFKYAADQINVLILRSEAANNEEDRMKEKLAIEQWISNIQSQAKGWQQLVECI